MEERGQREVLPLSFAYHQGIAPMMWVLVALSTVELFAVHLLVALWKPWLAAILSVATLLSILWIVRLIRSMKRLPVLVDVGGVLMRIGTLREIRLPYVAISGIRSAWPSGTHKEPAVLNLALISYPNVMIDLVAPMKRPGRSGRMIASVAHRLDDAGGFTRVVEACLRS